MGAPAIHMWLALDKTSIFMLGYYMMSREKDAACPFKLWRSCEAVVPAFFHLQIWGRSSVKLITEKVTALLLKDSVNIRSGSFQITFSIPVWCLIVSHLFIKLLHSKGKTSTSMLYVIQFCLLCPVVCIVSCLPFPFCSRPSWLRQIANSQRGGGFFFPLLKGSYSFTLSPSAAHCGLSDCWGLLTL